MAETRVNSKGTVNIGTPITTEQATRGILRLIKSPLVGNVDVDMSPGTTLQRIFKTTKDGSIYQMLSNGERALVEIAYGIWHPTSDIAARIGILGSLDKDNRRKVIVCLTYLYLGRDLLVLEATDVEFIDLFEEREKRRG